MISPMPRLEPGSVVQGLRVERELGRGAFGTVYLAEDELLGRRVALKVVATPALELRDRGLQEARVVARVKSPFIVTLYRVHALANDQGWLLEMEYVGGGSLKELLAREGRFAVPRALEIARGVLDGLRSAHAVGIVHGDIKPGNVLLEPSGAVKLADFGLSWLIDDATISSIGSGPVGTPAYMAPEVILGERNRMPSDLWGVGVILYEMLAGRLPFRATRLQEFFLAVVNAEPPPLPPGVPLFLQRLVARLLSKSASDRPTAEEAFSDLDGAAREQPGRAPPAPARLHAGPQLCGRASETGVLKGVLDRLGTGEGAALLVTGEAGVGKSALLQWMLAEAGARGMLTLEVTVSRLEGALRPLLAGARRIVPPDFVVPGLPEAVGTQLLHGDRAWDAGTRQQVAWMVAQIFEALGRERPLVLAVENAQEADAEDARLLKDLLLHLPANGIVTAVAFRTHDAESSRAGDSAASLHEIASVGGLRMLELAPLSPEAIHMLLERQTHASHIEPSVAQRLVGFANGNPLLATEMLHHLSALGSVVTDGSSLRPAAGWDGATLPARFHDLVARRLAGLSETHRALLDAAAVDGRVFDGEALQAVLGRPLLEILRDLQRLYRERHLVEPQGEGYRFTSPLLQEVLYEEIAPALRRAIHRGLAEHLEQRGEGVDAGRIGVHWEQAGAAGRAAPHLMRAAAEAARRQEKLRLIDLCRRGGVEPGKIGPEQAQAHLDTLLRLAAALRELGRLDEMDRVYDDLLKGVHDEGALCRIRVRRTMAHYHTRGAKSVDRPFLERAAATLPVCAESGNAKMLLGLIAKMEGHPADAERAFRAADADFRAVGDDGLRTATLNQLAALAMRAQRHDDAESLYRDAGRLARETGRPINAAIADINGALAALEGGRIDGLDAEVESALRTLMMAGTGPVPSATIMLAHVLYAQGRLPDAFARVESGVDLLRQYADPASTEAVRSEEAHLAAVQGLLPRARGALDEARTAAEGRGHLLARVSLACIGAQLHCMEGDLDAARKAALRANELAAGAEEASVGQEAALWLSEAVVYGLPADCLPPGPHPFVDAARAFALPGRALLPPEGIPGHRREILRLVRDLWAAEALRRAGRGEAAATAMREVVDGARALGHVWMTLASMARLHAWTGDAAIAEERSHLLLSVAERTPVGAERERLLAAWAAGVR